MMLKQDIKYCFFKTLIGEKSIIEFEQWLYKSKDLEKQLSQEAYLDLISFNFRQPRALHELTKLLKGHIDLAEFETWKLQNLLDKVDQKQGEYPRAILKFYDLYCSGYSFLDNLGYGYGLILECPYSKFSVDSFDQLTQDQQKGLADSFYPEISSEIQRVKNWLDTGKIVLTGDQDEANIFTFIDNRTKIEREPTTYKRKILPSKDKKWWQIWK